MRYTHWLLLILVIAVLLVVAVFWIYPPTQKQGKGMDEIERIQRNPHQDYITTLEATIRNNPDPSVREQAVFALASVALTNNETDRITGFLKDLAMNNPDENVMNAAYATLFSIREQYPLEKVGRLNLTVTGDIRKGGTIKVVATVLSTTDISKAVVGLDWLDPQITLLSPPVVHESLKAHEPKKVEFTFRLDDTGEYMIPFSAILSFDQVDYELVEKQLMLILGDTSGEYINEEEFPARSELFTQ